MLRRVVTVGPPFEISSLLFLGAKILDKIESGRRKLRLEDRSIKASDHRFPERSGRLDHLVNAGRRLFGSECVTVEV
jgi:hypothetical protein